jgi:membrane fusion protein, multidrug efflux system
LLFLLITLILGCDQNQSAQLAQPTEQPPSPVAAVAAVSRDVPMYLDAIGKTLPVESVSIVPQIGGKVIGVHVEDGAYLTKGQLLFEIDPRPSQAALAAAKASLAQSQAEAEWAQADFKRTEELMVSKVVSQLEFDQKKSAVGVAQAKIDAAKAAIEEATLDTEYTKIYSPIDGRAGARLIDQGNIVKENETFMLVIQRLDPIYAEFTVTENDLGTVRKFMASRGREIGRESDLGLKVEVDVPGDSARVLSALGAPTTQTAPRTGTLTFLDNTVQSGSGTVKLRATLANPDRYFWPGQFVNVRLILATKKDAVLIPPEAQQIGQQGPFVYIVRPDQTAELRPIIPGQRQGNLMVVESGIKTGEMVITSGQMMVMPNGKVMVTNQAPAGPTAQANN